MTFLLGNNLEEETKWRAIGNCSASDSLSISDTAPFSDTHLSDENLFF